MNIEDRISKIEEEVGNLKQDNRIFHSLVFPILNEKLKQYSEEGGISNLTASQANLKKQAEEFEKDQFRLKHSHKPKNCPFCNGIPVYEKGSYFIVHKDSCYLVQRFATQLKVEIGDTILSSWDIRY